MSSRGAASTAHSRSESVEPYRRSGGGHRLTTVDSPGTAVMAWTRSSLKASAKPSAARSNGSEGFSRSVISRRVCRLLFQGRSVSQRGSLSAPAVPIRQVGIRTRISSVNTSGGISSARASISTGGEAEAWNSDFARDDPASRCVKGTCRSMRVKQKSSGLPCSEVWNSAARMPLPSSSSTNRSQATALERVISALGSSKGMGKAATLRGKEQPTAVRCRLRLWIPVPGRRSLHTCRGTRRPRFQGCNPGRAAIGPIH